LRVSLSTYYYSYKF